MSTLDAKRWVGSQKLSPNWGIPGEEWKTKRKECLNQPIKGRNQPKVAWVPFR